VICGETGGARTELRGRRRSAGSEWREKRDLGSELSCTDPLAALTYARLIFCKRESLKFFACALRL
jgi:hypothetical protein